MVIIGRQAGGYRINCNGNGTNHQFSVQNLGSTVFCPECGKTESAIDLTTNYIFLRRNVAFGRQQAPVQSFDPVDEANDYIFAHRRPQRRAS